MKTFEQQKLSPDFEWLPQIKVPDINNCSMEEIQEFTRECILFGKVSVLIYESMLKTIESR
jgi:hypothetical protein